MDCVGAKELQEILSFPYVGHHFFTLSLVLIYNLADDELGITVDLQGFHLHFLGKIKSCYQCFILSFVVRGFEPESESAMHSMSLGADKYQASSSSSFIGIPMYIQAPLRNFCNWNS